MWYGLPTMVTVMHVTNKLAIAAVASLLAITACDRADPRIQNLTVGIPKDSVIAVMEGEAPKRIDHERSFSNR